MLQKLWTIFLLLSISILLPAQEELKKKIEDSIRGKKAQVGVAVILNGQDTITVNNNAQYPMMSVFKFHQALAVAHYLNQKGLPLSTPIYITKKQLKTNTYSPLRDQFPNGNIALPISKLLTYTLQLSDNNACDILFDYIGGTAWTDRYIRSLGMENFSIEVNEDEMHKDLSTCYRNWSTPLEAARLLETFLNKKLFADSSHRFIWQALTTCETGKDRLAKPLTGSDAIIGHKTGTGDRNQRGEIIGLNDIGFVLLPDGQQYTIAVFIKDSQESMQTTTDIIADVSTVVYRYMTSKDN